MCTVERTLLEHSYSAIAIVKGKLLSITIHVPPISVAFVPTPEVGDIVDGDEQHASNGFTTPSLPTEKDAHLASLSVARCGFGIVATSDSIYAVGMFATENVLVIVRRVIFRWLRSWRLFGHD